MSSGAVLKAHSPDARVAADLPAWRRMAGHAYLGGCAVTHAPNLLPDRNEMSCRVAPSVARSARISPTVGANL